MQEKASSQLHHVCNYLIDNRANVKSKTKPVASPQVERINAKGGRAEIILACPSGILYIPHIFKVKGSFCNIA